MTGALNPYAQIAAQQQSALANHQNNMLVAQQSAAQQQLISNMYNTASTSSAGGLSALGNSYLSGIAGTSSSTVLIPLTSTSTGANTFTGRVVGAVSYSSLRIPDGQASRIEIPDGTIIDVKADGSFTVEDAAAKVIYRANRVRDFNPFLNASDKIEEFIAFCGEHGVRQGEMLELPLNLFIGWLVLEAAKADCEPEPNLPLLADLRKRAFSRCRSCGRFMKEAMAANKIEFCASSCFERTYQKALAA